MIRLLSALLGLLASTGFEVCYAQNKQHGYIATVYYGKDYGHGFREAASIMVSAKPFVGSTKFIENEQPIYMSLVARDLVGTDMLLCCAKSSTKIPLDSSKTLSQSAKAIEYNSNIDKFCTEFKYCISEVGVWSQYQSIHIGLKPYFIKFSEFSGAICNCSRLYGFTFIQEPATKKRTSKTRNENFVFLTSMDTFDDIKRGKIAGLKLRKIIRKRYWEVVISGRPIAD